MKASVKWLSLIAFVCLVGCSKNQDINKTVKSIDQSKPRPQAVNDKSEESVGKAMKK